MMGARIRTTAEFNATFIPRSCFHVHGRWLTLSVVHPGPPECAWSNLAVDFKQVINVEVQPDYGDHLLGPAQLISVEISALDKLTKV